MYLSVILAFFVVIFLIFSLSKRKYPSIMKIPGPKPNFFMGNMIDFIGPTSEFLLTLKKYHEEYGNLFKVHDGPLNCLVLVCEEKFMEYILSSTKIIDKADQYEYFHNWLGTGLLTSTGIKWKKRRRMLTPSFHFSILESFVEVFNSVGDIFIKKLDRVVGEPSVDIYPLVSLCALDIICEAAMGIQINAQTDGNSEYVRNVKKICSIITDRNFSPLDTRVYPFTLNYFREKAALKVLHNHTDNVIDERMKSTNLKNENKENNEFGIKSRVAFLDLLIKYRSDGESLSRLDIREEVDTFMFEGHDTTTSAISFAMYNLAANPEVQNKAFEEQQLLFGDQKNPKVTMANLQEMKYLELVIKESLRLYPPVPFFARKVSEEFEYEGVVYPRGLNMLMLPYLSHRNAKYFPDPEKFIPDRFIEDGGRHPYMYIPFSAGPRNCIGQRFAMLEIKATVSKVLRNFELLPAQPEHELKVAPEIILISKNGIRISLRRRS